MSDIIDAIADHLVDDHVALLAENKRLRDELAGLKERTTAITAELSRAHDEAVERIEALEAENAALKQEAERSTRRLVELSAPGSIGAFASRDHWKERAEKAEAENAALRADAERYRWLCLRSGGVFIQANSGKEELDAAIDAAREGR